MKLDELSSFCDDYLGAGDFNDYCPNGLQVESNTEVKHIVSGVTASLALIEAAIELGADTLLVHHGYFWKGEAQPITGFKGRRIAALLRNKINLLAYHLPLDVHPEVGNNVQLAKVMGWEVNGSFGATDGHDLVLQSRLTTPVSLQTLSDSIADKLDTNPLMIAGGEHQINTLAWCTGAAQGYIEQAAAQGVDAFISGEVSEHTCHFAREAGIHYLAAGHHATERYGVQALARVIEQRFGIRQQFVDIPNPV